MNDLTGLRTDGRRGDLSHRWNPDKPAPKHDKYKGAANAWKIEFPGVPPLHYRGCNQETYKRLNEAGWKFSSKYGWRKPNG